MVIPKKSDLKKIQGKVQSSDDFKASVCGSSGNCTCGGSCGLTDTQKSLKLEKKVFKF